MRKKKKHSLFFYFIPLFVILFLILNNIRIPIGKPFFFYVNKKYDNILRDLNIRADDVSINIFGKIRLKSLRVSSPQVLFANRVSLDISLISWLFGSLHIQSLDCDSILIAADEMAPFSKELQNYFSIPRKIISDLHSEPIRINVNKATMRHSDPPEYFNAKNLSVHVKHPGKQKPVFELSLEDISCPNWPSLSKLQLEGSYYKSVIDISEIQLKLPSGKINSKIKFNTKEKLVSGGMEFGHISLKKLTQAGFFGDSELEGELEAKLNFNLPLSKIVSTRFGGHIYGENIRAVNLPVQKDPVIENFMPAFKDLTFSRLSLLGINLEENKIKFDTLLADGNPLSLNGHGYVTHEGKLYFFLNCFITEAYFNELKGVVRDAMVLQEDGRYQFKCEVVGDFKNQKIKMGKIIGQVFKSNLNKIGRGIKNLFR